MSTTIRISTETRAVLGALAQSTGLSMQTILEQAIDMYRRHQMLVALNNAYAARQTDQDAWDDLDAADPSSHLEEQTAYRTTTGR